MAIFERNIILGRYTDHGYSSVNDKFKYYISMECNLIFTIWKLTCHSYIYVKCTVHIILISCNEKFKEKMRLLTRIYDVVMNENKFLHWLTLPRLPEKVVSGNFGFMEDWDWCYVSVLLSESSVLMPVLLLR